MTYCAPPPPFLIIGCDALLKAAACRAKVGTGRLDVMIGRERSSQRGSAVRRSVRPLPSQRRPDAALEGGNVVGWARGRGRSVQSFGRSG